MSNSENSMTREEHLAWAKERSLQETSGAQMWGSFISDMSKHKELSQHIGLFLGNSTLVMERFDEEKVKKFILDFN